MMFSMIFSLMIALNNPVEGSELEEPLWRGSITLEVSGPLYTQYLANQLTPEKRRIIGFIKEKGQMQLDLMMDLGLVINALGEYELQATEKFTANYSLTREARRTEKKEVLNGGVKVKPKFHISTTKRTKVAFEKSATYSADSFSVGNIRVLPSGRLDKKGKLSISGDLRFEYVGKGKFLESVEQQPKDIDGLNKHISAEVSKTFILPMTFEIAIDLKGDPVSGSGKVTTSVANPFTKTEDDDAKSVVYKDNLVGKVAYSFTPLFDKKKRKKGKR